MEVTSLSNLSAVSATSVSSAVFFQMPGSSSTTPLPSLSEVPSELPPFLSPYCVMTVGRGSRAKAHKMRLRIAMVDIVVLKPANIWQSSEAETP